MHTTLLWYTARAAGIVTWALLAASVLWGLALSTRVLRGRPRPAWLLDLHRFLGGAAVVFLAVHIVTILFDTYVHFGLVEVLVPLTGTWRTGAVAWGIVAMYLLVAVELTSLARARLPKRVWDASHYIAFPLFLFASIHALTAGTDRSAPALRLAVFGVGAAVALLTAVRAAEVARHGPERARRPLPPRPRGGRPEAAMSAVAAAVRTDERRLLREVRGGRPVTLAEHRSRYRPPSPPGRRPQPALIDLVAEAGLRGRGGAGFPTARKLAAVAGGRGPPDRGCQRHRGRAGQQQGPGPRDTRRTWSSTVRRSPPPPSAPRGSSSASTAQTAGPCGRCAHAIAERAVRGATVAIELAATPTRYVAGEETALVHYLNGGEAKPTHVPPRPFEKGVDGRPTLSTTSRRWPTSPRSPASARPGSARPGRATSRGRRLSP